MKAVVLRDVTNSDDIVLEELEVPRAKKGWVLVKITAFGMNHSELVLRVNEIRADYISKPLVPGIECVGVVEESLDEEFKRGDAVCSLMGGMGRNFNGSYEEYALLPAQKLFHISSGLDTEHLAAVPETFFTAWGSLFECLRLQPSDTLLVRGATSALGYASMQIAAALGCRVFGTTHKKEKDWDAILTQFKTSIENAKTAEELVRSKETFMKNAQGIPLDYKPKVESALDVYNWRYAELRHTH